MAPHALTVGYAPPLPTPCCRRCSAVVDAAPLPTPSPTPCPACPCQHRATACPRVAMILSRSDASLLARRGSGPLGGTQPGALSRCRPSSAARQRSTTGGRLDYLARRRGQLLRCEQLKNAATTGQEGGRGAPAAPSGQEGGGGPPPAPASR